MAASENFSSVSKCLCPENWNLSLKHVFSLAVFSMSAFEFFISLLHIFPSFSLWISLFSLPINITSSSCPPPFSNSVNLVILHQKGIFGYRRCLHFVSWNEPVDCVVSSVCMCVARNCWLAPPKELNYRTKENHFSFSPWLGLPTCPLAKLQLG